MKSSNSINKDIIDKEISIKHDDETDLMQALLKDYELVWNRIEGISTRIIQVVGVGFAFISLVIGYVLDKPPIPIIFWFVPMLFLPLFAYIVYCIYITTASLWNARFLSQRINCLLKEKAFIRHVSDLPEAQFFSTKRGSLKFRLLYLIIFIASGSLFSIMLVTSFITIYTKLSHLQGTIFVLFYGLVVIILSVSCFGFLQDLPDAFQAFLKEHPDGEKIPIISISNSSGGKQNTTKGKKPPTKFQKVIAHILPRQWDFLAKGFFFIFGLGTAFVIAGSIPKDVIWGLSYNRLQLINSLFSTNTVSISSHGYVPPFWAICTLGLVYFFVEEFLLQQAKLIWDDIRDISRDEDLIHNKERAITTKLLSIPSAIWQMLGRLLLAFILGYFLGGMALVSVFLLICLHQIVYVLWAKPRGKEHPIALLCILSFNVSLRFLAGVTSIIGFNWFFIPNPLQPIILLLGIFYCYSFGVLAAFWKMEAEDCKKNKPLGPRPQSLYYLNRGIYYQHIGLLVALVLSSALFFFNSKNIVVTGIVIAVLIITTLFVLYYVIVYYYQKNTKIPLIIIVIKNLSPILLISSYCTFIDALVTKDQSTLFLSNCFLITYYLLLYEGMTYLEYSFENIKKRLPQIKLCWYTYLFKPNKNLGFKQLIIITFSDTDLSKLGIDETELKIKALDS